MHIFPEMRLSLTGNIPKPSEIKSGDQVTYLTGFADYAMSLVVGPDWNAELFGELLLYLQREGTKPRVRRF